MPKNTKFAERVEIYDFSKATVEMVVPTAKLTPEVEKALEAYLTEQVKRYTDEMMKQACGLGWPSPHGTLFSRMGLRREPDNRFSIVCSCDLVT